MTSSWGKDLDQYFFKICDIFCDICDIFCDVCDIFCDTCNMLFNDTESNQQPSTKMGVDNETDVVEKSDFNVENDTFVDVSDHHSDVRETTNYFPKPLPGFFQVICILVLWRHFVAWQRRYSLSKVIWWMLIKLIYVIESITECVKDLD